jgi:hypothetical protein
MAGTCVGNRSFRVIEQQLTGVLGIDGEVDTVSVITDRATGRSRGSEAGS